MAFYPVNTLDAICLCGDRPLTVMQQSSRQSSPQPRWQPLDRLAIVVILFLSLLIGVLLLFGGHVAPKVRDFSWSDRRIGANDTAFLLTFSRPMNQASVEQNLRIVPSLKGKVSWAGRRMAYTLENPAPYGTAFEVELANAQDRFSQPNDTQSLRPFSGRFRTRDRAFIYIGVGGDEEGRIVLENLTRQEHRILTPADLVVMEFEPYPQGDRILFSATERTAVQRGSLDQKLYSVTTGLAPEPTEPTQRFNLQPPKATTAQPSGIVTQILGSDDYQNLKFDLSPDGQKIILQRVNRKNPSDFGLWMIQEGQEPQPLKTEPGGDFLIAPDSNALAMSQGQGLAILPLASDAEPLDFLAKFGQILDFSNDGTLAATVQFNALPNAPTKSLYTVTNQGQEKELLKTDGSILSAEFGPMKRYLYVLITKRFPSEEVFLEEPYLVVVNLQTSESTTLLKLPPQRDIQMSLSPDGLGILFDQVVSQPSDGTAPAAGSSVLQGSDGSAIASSQLWFLPLTPADPGTSLAIAPPEALALPGLRPRWMP